MSKLWLALVACKDKQEAPKVDITAEHLAAIPPELTGKIEFEIDSRKAAACSKVSGD